MSIYWIRFGDMRTFEGQACFAIIRTDPHDSHTIELRVYELPIDDAETQGLRLGEECEESLPILRSYFPYTPGNLDARDLALKQAEKRGEKAVIELERIKKIAGEQLMMDMIYGASRSTTGQSLGKSH